MENPGGKLSFLVVDDEPLIGAVLERVLFPHNVQRCTSAEDARKVLSSGAGFHLILTDLMLPGESGMELWRWVLTHRAELAPYVLFMTGSPHSKLAWEAREASKHPLLIKPFNLAEVRAAITEATGTPLDP